MPATVPACWGSRFSSWLMRGRAREMFVRSMKAMVYMISATGMMRVQRAGARLEAGRAGITLARSAVCEEASMGGGCARRSGCDAWQTRWMVSRFELADSARQHEYKLSRPQHSAQYQ